MKVKLLHLAPPTTKRGTMPSRLFWILEATYPSNDSKVVTLE